VPAQAANERLGGKASDEQRVDNCKVPPDLRGRARSDAATGGAKSAERRPRA